MQNDLPVRLTRIDPSRNMRRVYIVDLESDLFGDWIMTRTHGRLGHRLGRVIMTSFKDPGIAWAAARKLVKSKCRRGYVANDPQAD
jgi:predicted DNA-binding WGR domain protein